MDEDLPLQVLTKIELREAELLAWGAVNAQWSEEEMQSLLLEEGADQSVLDHLLQKNLIVRTPGGGYRTRSAETMRLLATQRQSFRGKPVTTGRPLVLDFHFLHRPRRRPRRDVKASVVLEDLDTTLQDAGMAAARALLPAWLSGFQRRSAAEVLTALNSEDPSGVMVTAGTGSGKTLAFYLPLLTWMADQLATGARRPKGVLVLALYPRNELLKDQLRALLNYIVAVNRTSATRKISVATWFGQTPTSAEYVRRGWLDEWRKDAKKQGFVCPFLRCLECEGELVWLTSDLQAKPARERLVCSDPSCAGEIDGSLLRLTRDSARTAPADLMLTTTESLNRQLATPGSLPAFGLGYNGSVQAVLLDEVHIYEGTTGAQNAVLLRRLRYCLGRTPVWVGLSATLSKADQFFGKLVDLPGNAITVVQPKFSELEESGAEYLVALRHNPFSETGPLSATIQTCMALTRSLDRVDDDPFSAYPTSGNIFGSKVFVFTDKLDSTNRLYWDLMDAEGRASQKYLKKYKPLTLAHLRSRDQSRVDKDDNKEPAPDRDPDGQWWWMAEHLGHAIEDDEGLVVGRTSSQDRGVAVDAQVVVATATLEVGFDDDHVGAVVQHKSPHDAAQFLQRKGRAGRDMRTRPWTVVVLSDWGRDRQAWDAYDALFDPDLPPRSLPVGNVYVLRIQAVYALMDWLAAELGYSERDSTWADLAGPAELLFSKNPSSQARARQRQQRLADKLAQLLRPGPERLRLRRHLRDALALGQGEIAESIVDTLLWEAPRPLMLAVVPTMRRRLQQQWRGEEPLADDLKLRTRTPMPEFVPGNLFDDLLVPDVELRLPMQGHRIGTERLPALRVLREFCPGNVSRHFGVFADNKRHWIPLPPAPAGQDLLVDVVVTYRATMHDTISVGDQNVIVYSPTAAELEQVPDGTRDASSVRPDWEFYAQPLGDGNRVELPKNILGMITRADAHLHLHGGGARIIRFARSAQGTIWDGGRRNVRLSFGTGGGRDWLAAAIGVEVQCDAIEIVVRQPDSIGRPTTLERTERLRQLITSELPDLPEAMTYFDRDRLFQVVLLTIASAGERSGQPGDAVSTDALVRAATILGVLDEQHEQAQNKMQWREWFADADTLSALDSAVAEVTAEDRAAAWTTWWRRTYTFSVATVVLAALSALCPGVDTEDVAIDLSPDDAGRFWFSEPSPGGTGQVEAFVRAVNEDPEGFTRAVEDALVPSAVETLDDELTALIRSTAADVHDALGDLRNAWRGGHDMVASAVQSVEDTARRHGVMLGGPARSALSTRIAGPGAHENLITEIAYWLQLRDDIGERTGLRVDPRTLGGLLAQRDELDDVLRLGDAAPPEKRARAVANVLWPWGQSPDAGIRAEGLSQFLPAIRDHIDLGPTTISVDVWDATCRAQVHMALIEHSEVVLRTPLTRSRTLRTVLLDLQTQPVEVDALLCHPIVVGVRRTEGAVEARLLLREAS